MITSILFARNRTIINHETVHAAVELSIAAPPRVEKSVTDAYLAAIKEVLIPRVDPFQVTENMRVTIEMESTIKQRHV
uniref:PHB domain-containing protein n=1 Tax=Heterorhabditis bacteriophora TaxID=37862 RepID=A0A1I7XIL5_HETBA